MGKESRPDKDQLIEFMVSGELGSTYIPSPRQMVQALTLSARGIWGGWRFLVDAFLHHNVL